MDRLSAYRQKRSAARTPEPVPEATHLPRGNDDTFVIQEHHARRLHWDFRLEREGVLVSWAIPKGLPVDPKRNHLAVRTEDHPLEYASFAGEIPAGEYGAGRVTIWDSGTYTCEKWSDDEVKVVLRGRRARGRYVLFRTRGTDWMIHWMDSPPDGWEPMPESIRPMLATRGKLPGDDAEFGYEMAWDGVRAIVYVDGGEVRITATDGADVSASYPELRRLGEALGSLRVVLDGVIVAVDGATKRISAEPLLPRLHVRGAAQLRRLAQQVPATYLAFDVLYLDGRSTLGLAYSQRRELMESLALRGTHWDTPPGVRELGGQAAMELARQQGLGGVIAKRLDSIYEQGRRSRSWIEVRK